MEKNCDYCGALISDSMEKCPSCGAVNANYKRVSNSQPKTLSELKAWYVEKNLPDERVTRFFIGKNIKEPKAFGIYRHPETGKYIVYKNKADGTRAVRYEGDDEAYAVNEIFQKLRETISIQKGMNAVDSNYGKSGTSFYNGSPRKKRRSLKTYLIVILCVWLSGVILAFGVALSDIFGGKKHPDRDKYYKYEDEYYYNFRGKYYYYNEDNNDWYYYGNDAPFDVDDYEDYEIDYDSSSDDLGNFYDSDVYHDWYDSQNDYDSDDNWDSGWDSNDNWDSDYGGDWDSDW